MKSLGWGLIVLAALCFIGFMFLVDWLGHYTGLVGLLSLFTGISLLKKRKDQL